MPVWTALSIVAPHGLNIARGRKTLEVRSWQPDQWPLNDLLIVENDRYLSADLPSDDQGRAVALVDVVAVRPWEPTDVQAALSACWQPGYWAWELSNVRPLDPTPHVQARLGLYTLSLSLPISASGS